MTYVKTIPLKSADIRRFEPVATAPIVGRMQTMWESMRGAVIASFPESAGPSEGQERISALRRRNLQKRRLSLVVHRGISRHAGADRTSAAGRLGPGSSRW